MGIKPWIKILYWRRHSGGGVRVESLKTLKTVEERSPRMVCVVWGAGKSACHTSQRCGVWCGVFVSSDQKGISFPPPSSSHTPHHTHHTTPLTSTGTSGVSNYVRVVVREVESEIFERLRILRVATRYYLNCLCISNRNARISKIVLL